MTEIQLIKLLQAELSEVQKQNGQLSLLNALELVELYKDQVIEQFITQQLHAKKTIKGSIRRQNNSSIRQLQIVDTK